MAANQHLIRTMSVKPPMGTGRVRLVMIGEDGKVDLQPCGGTHVRSTGEIGPVAVTKIENKGKINRRIRVCSHERRYRFDRMAARRIWARPTSPSSMRHGTCPRRSAMPKKEFLEAHIPGAQFFDIDELSDTASSLPHMLPSPEKFSSRMRKMGIGDGKRIIAYDAAGLFSAARAWWMFKVFGHEDVAVLDGGLPKWKAEGRPLEDGPPLKPQERHFTARFRSMMVRDMKDVAAALKSGSAQVADARSGTRFRGEEAEPRPGVRAGHMPGAQNVHYASLLKADGTLKSPAEIEAVFKAAGVDLSKPVITSCGSGITPPSCRWA